MGIPSRSKHCLVLSCSIALGFISSASFVHAAAVCPDPIRIGITTPLTGGIALQGSQVKNAVETAVDEINAAGGVSGKKIKLIVEDTTGTVTVAISALNLCAARRPSSYLRVNDQPRKFRAI